MSRPVIRKGAYTRVCIDVRSDLLEAIARSGLTRRYFIEKALEGEMAKLSKLLAPREQG